MNGNYFATIAQISDLHFIEDITEEGRRLWLKKFVKSHAYAKVQALQISLDKLQLERRSYAPDEQIDLLLATGDISTDGSHEAMTTARSFIRDRQVWVGGSRGPSRPVAVDGVAVRGMGLDRSRLLVIPGNHDRYTAAFLPVQRPSLELEQVFELENRYPYVVGYRRPQFRNNIGQPALIFFVLDSTPPEFKFFKWYEIHKLTARGRLTDGDCVFLRDASREIRDSGRVKVLGGMEDMPVDYDNAVRVAVLHHHPVDITGSDPWDFTTLLEGRDGFLGSCFDAGVDLVLFGHQHRKGFGLRTRPAPGGLHGPSVIKFFCCPSTTEYSCTENGFFVFKFGFDRCSVETHAFTGTAFELKSEDPVPYGRHLNVR